MKKIIGCINKKGGCGKTTSLMALADGLAMRGEKILIVDLDSQMNISKGYGDLHLSPYSMYNVICDKGFNIYDAICSVPKEYFSDVELKGKVDIIPANSNVDRLQEEMNKMMRKEERLLRALQKLNGEDYDYILIDTGPLPVTDIVVTNAMVASDEILVPTKLEVFSTTGIELIYPRIEQLVEEELNPELKINGILCTQIDSRRKKTNGEIYEKLLEYANKKGIYVYENYIRDLEGVVSNQKNNKTIYTPNIYTRKTVKKNGEEVVKTFTSQTEIAKDYKAFVDEFLERGNE